MRSIEIIDDELKGVLTERGEVVVKARDLQKKVEKLQTEQQKLGYTMDRLRDKTTPLMEKHNNEFDLDEFELVGRVYLEEDAIKVDIVDQMEEYANLLREKMKKAE